MAGSELSAINRQTQRPLCFLSTLSSITPSISATTSTSVQGRTSQRGGEQLVTSLKKNKGKEKEHATPSLLERGDSLVMEEGLSCCLLGLTFLSAWLLLDPRVSVLLCSSAWQLVPIVNQWPRSGMRTSVLGQTGQELIAPVPDYLSLQVLVW